MSQMNKVMLLILQWHMGKFPRDVAPCATKSLNLSTSGRSALAHHAKEIKLGELDIKRKNFFQY